MGILQKFNLAYLSVPTVVMPVNLSVPVSCRACCDLAHLIKKSVLTLMQNK